MSVKYGVNGNDLDWESMEGLNSFILELEQAIATGEAEFDDDGSITDEYYQGVMDGNPRIAYYDGEGIDIQKIINEGNTIEDYIEWAIIHDTNGNFVTLIGNVPDEFFTEEYIRERNEAEGK